MGLLGVIPLFTPVSVLAGASIAIPAIYKLLTSKENAESVDQESVNELHDYIARHSLTKEEALEKGFKFPPGHPKVGGTYVPHPLSSYPHSLKRDLYIPEHVFDEILFEEREAELLTLLVKLGATEVEISKNVNFSFLEKNKLNIGANVNGVGSSSLSGEKDIENENNANNTRTFLLKGKPWGDESKIDKNEFAWLQFEPSWNALVTAREIGGCTCASLEIKEASKYTSNKNLAMQLQASIYSGQWCRWFISARFAGNIILCKSTVFLDSSVGYNKRSALHPTFIFFLALPYSGVFHGSHFTLTSSIPSYISNKDSIAAPFWPLPSAPSIYWPTSYYLFFSHIDKNNDQKDPQIKQSVAHFPTIYFNRRIINSLTQIELLIIYN
ncbi:hypothetical protein RY972_09900 [Aeromonas allosaccharophila]|uniref:Uncharacterized protein n=1 Tax=Aeromonas allosaccharophila TaxID=656 RepID=A0ABZ0FG49_9GAMM|nr:hypothetical protein [Aeromonas allosaccharophila]WOE68328.1 hypothetical protein RY972_09900 [Aeromonas allosaccharophila]